MDNRYSSQSKDRSHHVERILRDIHIPISNFSNIIEFGCGNGITLESLTFRHPFEISVGLDTNLTSEQNERSPVKYIRCDLNQSTPTSCFSFLDPVLYYALDVLEHLVNPYRIVQEFEEKAPDGSALIVTVPNFASIRMLYAWAIGYMPRNEFGFFDHSHLHWLAPEDFAAFDSLVHHEYLYSERSLIGLTQRIWSRRLCSQFTLVFLKVDSDRRVTS